MDETWIRTIERALGEISERQKSTNESIAGMRRELFGNGQPGAIGRLFDLYRQNQERIVAVERAQSKMLGIWLGVSGALSAATGWAAAYLRGRV